MHQLTIDHHNTTINITSHPSFDDAYRALLHYIIGADYYLQAVKTTTASSHYRLLRPVEPDDPPPARRPQLAGLATIAHLHDTEPR